jgi:hypothetical protein
LALLSSEQGITKAENVASMALSKPQLLGGLPPWKRSVASSR